MALHSRDEVIVSAADATQSRSDGNIMEGHTILSTALVFRLVFQPPLYSAQSPRQNVAAIVLYTLCHGSA